MVIWLFGYLVIWLFGYLVIWLFGYLVIWLFGYLVIWLFGYLVIWLFGYLFIWLFGYLVIWLFGYLVIWLFGYLVIWLFGSTTAVRCAVGVTEGFEVKVGLHQGSALSPCLFAMMMDRMTDEIREEAPWTMMFADDIVICSESKEQVEEKLESWRYALERRGMKVNRRKTEYMCVNERQDNGSGTVKMQGEEVAKVEDFKYLGSTVQSNGECGREVKKRVQAGWNGWRRMSGVICDRRVPARVKGKVYKVAVRPAMLYGLETVALTKRQEAEMEVAELKMLRFSLGVTRMDKIRNECIRGTAQVGKFGEKTREARLRWYGHLRRKDDGYIGRRMLRMELPGKRKRGRPKRRFMDVVKEDMAEVEVTEEDTVDRRNWRKKIRCGDP